MKNFTAKASNKDGKLLCYSKVTKVAYTVAPEDSGPKMKGKENIKEPKYTLNMTHKVKAH